MLPFLTAYDPLGASSGSIDPLGALRTYGALADMLLPGVTTITNRSRYLSMLCAALANSENNRDFVPGASGLAQRRKSVEPFERLWALGCVAARENGTELAADGLRGVTYAAKAFQHFAHNENSVNPDFKMLKYQSRTGAVGTYWTALIGGELAHSVTGALSVEGFELADEFPIPPLSVKDCRRLADPQVAHHVSMRFDEFIEWAEACHLVAASGSEQEQLGDALTADDRRECVARALSRMNSASGLPDEWDAPSVEQLREELDSMQRAVDLSLPTVVDAVLATEQFHEAALVVFQILLWCGTQHSGKPIEDLIRDHDLQKAIDRCGGTAASLLAFQDKCGQARICDAIQGLTGFAYAIDRSMSHRFVVDEILSRHHHVQSGKVDGGAPKRDWISFDGNKLLRPSPRFQRREPPPPALGKSLTHPYRLEPFVYMLRENNVLPQRENEMN